MEKKLYRSVDDQILGGVAAGIAEYLEIDVTLVRLLWGMAMIAGFGVVAYILAWVIIPPSPKSKSQKSGAEEIKERAEQVASEFRTPKKNDDVKVERAVTDFGFWLGLFIIFFAVAILFQNIFGFSFWQNFWPIILVAFGAILITRSIERK